MSWPLVKLHDVCRPRQWKTISASDLLEEGYPVYGANGKIGFYSEYTHEFATLMITCRGATCGNVHISEPKSYINGNAMALDVLDSERVDIRFLYYYLLGRGFDDVISGSAQPQITGQGLAKIEIPLPPLPEQKRIAAILDKADAIRRKRQQAIQLADEFLRAVFLDMFGDVIEGAENVVRFSDVAVLDAPMVDPRVDEYIDLIHIGPDRIEKKIGKLLPALTAREEGLISKKFLFDDRYVLYSKIRPYLRKCAMAEGVGLCSADMYPVRPVEGVATKEFLWMLLLSDFFTAYTESLPARANIPKLNREELEAFTLSLPDYSRQLKFSSIVRATNIASQRVVESAAYVDGAFESLSQKAFSGQL